MEYDFRLSTQAGRLPPKSWDLDEVTSSTARVPCSGGIQEPTSHVVETQLRTLEDQLRVEALSKYKGRKSTKSAGDLGIHVGSSDVPCQQDRSNSQSAAARCFARWMAGNQANSRYELPQCSSHGDEKDREPSFPSFSHLELQSTREATSKPRCRRESWDTRGVNVNTNTHKLASSCWSPQEPSLDQNHRVNERQRFEEEHRQKERDVIKRRLQIMEHREKEAIKDRAALQIQRFFRSYIAWIRVKELRVKKRRQQDREMIERKLSQMERQRKAAAIKIQSWVRAILARQTVQDKRRERQLFIQRLEKERLEGRLKQMDGRNEESTRLRSMRSKLEAGLAEEEGRQCERILQAVDRAKCQIIEQRLLTERQDEEIARLRLLVLLGKELHRCHACDLGAAKLHALLAALRQVCSAVFDFFAGHRTDEVRDNTLRRVTDVTCRVADLDPRLAKFALGMGQIRLPQRV